MPRFTFAVVLAVVAVVALPASTSATAFDHHFSVVTDPLKFEQTNNGFRFKDALVNKFDFSQRVGRVKVRCRFPEGRGKTTCHSLFHFDGTVGGFGNLLSKGNLGGRDNTLLIVNGDGDFNGVTGKLTVHTPPPGPMLSLHFDLVR